MKAGFNRCLVMLFLMTFILGGCAVETMNELFNAETDLLNAKAYALIMDGEYDEAVEVLRGIISKDDLNDTAYNNLAWALYLKGDYAEALDNSEKSLSIFPDTDAEYVNHGNILLQISDDYEAALRDYETALALNPESSSALYGKGMVLNILGRLEESYDAYSEYLLICPDDPDGHVRLGYVCLGFNRTDDAREQARWLSKAGSPEGLILKAACEHSDGNAGMAMDLLREAAASDKYDYEHLDKICEYMGKSGDLWFEMDLIETWLEKRIKDFEAYLDLIGLYMNLEDYDGAIDACLLAVGIFPDRAELYNALGDAYSAKTAYKDAIRSYAAAVEIDPAYWLAESNLIWGMYQAGQYRECIDYCSRLENEGRNEFEIFWYQAASYDAMLETEKALEYYEKSLPFDTGNDSDTCYRIAYIHINEGNIILADKFNKLSLGYNPGNPDAVWLSKQIKLKGMPVTDQLSDFIANNYLYRSHIPEIHEKLDALEGIEKPSPEVIGEMIESIIPEYDSFTYYLTGEDYAAFSAEPDSGTVHYSIEEVPGEAITMHRFKIDCFARGTALEFIDLADKIEDPVNSVLVLDLRGNAGGDMNACCEILDYLLGECAVCTLYDKDGFSKSYYSDADRVEFRKTCILTDENTASAAELLTLSLAVYSDNTVIIGRNTFGKGVCQQVFDSPEHGFALFLVDTYWNVRQINIYYYGITPDIEARSESEYEKAILSSIVD